jgi:hypothetical protein
LFALAAAAQHNSKICFSVAHVSTNRGTNGGIVTALGGMGTQIVNIVTLICEHLNKVLLQSESCVVGTNGYS